MIRWIVARLWWWLPASSPMEDVQRRLERRERCKLKERGVVKSWLDQECRFDDERTFERAATAIEEARFRGEADPEWAQLVYAAFCYEFDQAMKQRAREVALAAQTAS